MLFKKIIIWKILIVLYVYFYSDPVSPNVPWHPELDRRHSDSVNVTKFAQTSADNDDLDNSTRSANQQKHTYQNTNLNSGTILLYNYEIMYYL